MSHPSISIIVPVYNCEKYLHNTLSSLIAQTLTNIEIILIDDGSSDKSSEICDQFAAEIPNIHVIHKMNGGVSNARNDGMKVSSGEYLLFCDADDIPDPQWAEKLYNMASKENADICFCGFTKEIDETMTDDIFPYSKTIDNQEEITKKLILPMCVWGYPCEYGVYGSVWRGAYRRDFINKVMVQFDSTVHLGEDLLFNTALLLQNPKISFVGECLYTYRENMNSATHTGHEQLWRKYKLLWQHIHTILNEQVSDEDLKWHNYQLSRYAINYIVEGICPRLVSHNKKSQEINRLLKDPDLQYALRLLPNNLSLKDSFLCWIMRMRLSLILLYYYQFYC